MESSSNNRINAKSFATVSWEDGKRSVIGVKDILSPCYEIYDEIQAKFQGNTYAAFLVAIGSKSYCLKIAEEGCERLLIQKFTSALKQVKVLKAELKESNMRVAQKEKQIATLVSGFQKIRKLKIAVPKVIEAASILKHAADSVFECDDLNTEALVTLSLEYPMIKVTQADASKINLAITQYSGRPEKQSIVADEILKALYPNHNFTGQTFTVLKNDGTERINCAISKLKEAFKEDFKLSKLQQLLRNKSNYLKSKLD